MNPPLISTSDATPGDTAAFSRTDAFDVSCLDLIPDGNALARLSHVVVAVELFEHGRPQIVAESRLGQTIAPDSIADVEPRWYAARDPVAEGQRLACCEVDCVAELLAVAGGDPSPVKQRELAEDCTPDTIIEGSRLHNRSDRLHTVARP